MRVGAAVHQACGWVMPAARSLMPAGGRGQPQGREHRADGRKGMRGPHRRRRALRSSSVTAAAPPTGRTLAGTHASKGPPAAGPPPGLAPGSPSLPWSRRCCDSTPAPSPPAGRTLGAALGLCAPSTAPSPPKLKPGRAWLSSSLPRPSLGRSTPASAAPSPWLSAAAPFAAGARQGGTNFQSQGLYRACRLGGPLRARDGRNLGVGAQRQPRRLLFNACVDLNLP